MGKILYIRHGQASVLSDNYDQLSEIGIQQARQLGNFLSKEELQIDRLYTGPLKRHHQTAEGMLQGMSNDIEIEEIEGLREHQGFSALKTILPTLVETDEVLRRLVNIPWKNRTEQIKHHMRIFENFSLRWAKGEFDDVIDEKFQSWQAFKKASTKAYEQIISNSASGMTSVVVTSGGPKAVACGNAMDLSLEKVIRTSWVIFNCSVSEFLISENRLTLSTFNNVSFFEDKNHRTLV